MKSMYEPGETPPLWVRLCWVEKAPGKYEEMEWGIIHPESFFVNCWNVCMAISILFAVIYIPFSLSFNYEPTLAQGGWNTVVESLQLVMDIYFLLDIFVEFRIAIIKHGEVEQDYKKIANAYIYSWFPLDLISTCGSLRWKLNIFQRRQLRMNRAITRLASLALRGHSFATANGVPVLLSTVTVHRMPPWSNAISFMSSICQRDVHVPFKLWRMSVLEAVSNTHRPVFSRSSLANSCSAMA